MAKIKRNKDEKSFPFLRVRSGGGGGADRSIKELPSQIVNEVVILGVLFQNSLPDKKAIRILVYFYQDKPLLFLIL